MKRIMATLLCILLCANLWGFAYAETEPEVIVTELSVTLGESIDLKPSLSNRFGSAKPSEYRFIDDKSANGVIRNGVFTPTTTDSVAVSPVFANGSDVCNGYRQIMVIYVVNRPGKNDNNHIALRSGQSIHLLELMPVEYRLASLPVTFHVVDAGEAEPVLDGDLLTVTDKPVYASATIKAVMKDGIAPGQDSEYEMVVTLLPEQTLPIFRGNREAVLCGEQIDIRNYLRDEVKQDLPNMICSLSGYGQTSATLNGWFISSAQPGVEWVKVTIRDYYGAGLHAEADLELRFCIPPAQYDTGRFEVDVEGSFDLVNALENMNEAWLIGGVIARPEYECNIVDDSRVSFKVIDQGQTGAEIVNDRTVVFANTGEAIVRAVMKDQFYQDGICEFDFVFSVYDYRYTAEYQFFDDVEMPVPISTQTSQYLGAYVEINQKNQYYGMSDYYDGLKVQYEVKDAGTTNAQIKDRVLYAPYEGDVVITITAKDAFGKGRDYSRDLRFAVEKKNGFVAAGSAVWDYYSGRLMQGTPPKGVSYNASSHTLMLEQAVLVADIYQRDALIQSDHDITVQLNGTNYLFSNDADFGGIYVSGYNNLWSDRKDYLPLEYVPGAGKLVLSGTGSLIADGGVGSSGGVMEIVDTDITAGNIYSGYISINDSRVDAGSMSGYYVVVDGKDSYVRCGDGDGYGIHFEYIAEDLMMLVRNGTVIAYGGLDWAYHAFGDWGFGDSSGFNLVPQIDPGYTNARVWMGHTEEEANARGPLPQKVLQPYNFYEYIRIAPIEEVQPTPTPVPSSVVPPQTGDVSPLFLYMAISSVSMLLLTIMVAVYRRKAA